MHCRVKHIPELYDPAEGTWLVTDQGRAQHHGARQSCWRMGQLVERDRFRCGKEVYLHRLTDHNRCSGRNPQRALKEAIKDLIRSMAIEAAAGKIAKNSELRYPR